MTPSKSEIALVRSLRHKKNRELHSLYVIEGVKMVEEAERSGVKIVKRYSRDEIGSNTMAKMSHISSPPPLLAVAKRERSREVKWPQKGELYLALDRVADPGNLGTIIRSAEWFGVDGLYLSEGSVDLYNPKVLHASMGSFFKVKSYQVDFNQLFAKSLEAEVPIYGTSPKGEYLVGGSSLAKGVVILGSEAHGVSEQYNHYIERFLSIPSFSTTGTIDSLNVAVAAAILCWEITRSTL
ncbi:MAG: RNA methyltransferase [Bacteroidales bacterium]